MSAPRSLAQRLRWLALALLFYAALMLLYGLALHPRIETSLRRATASLDSARKEIQALEVTADRLPEVRRRLLALPGQVAELDRILPPTPALPLLRQRLAELATESNAKLVHLEAKPGKPIRFGSLRPGGPSRFVDRLSLTVKAHGTLRGLIELVQQTNRLSRRVGLIGIELTRSGSPSTELTLRLDAETYVWRPEAASLSPRCQRDAAALYRAAPLVLVARPLEARIATGEGWRRLEGRYRVTRRFKGASAPPGSVIEVGQVCLDERPPGGDGNEPTLVQYCASAPDALPGFAAPGDRVSAANETLLFLQYPWHLPLGRRADRPAREPLWAPVPAHALEPLCSAPATEEEPEGLRELEEWMDPAEP